MFAITTPQTVTLTIPGDDGPSTLINFRTNDADTSRCVLEIVTPEGDTHRLTFNVRGSLVDSQFIGHDSAPEDPAPQHAGEYMVDGRDTRAFNPYTYQPPVSADAAAHTGAGFKAVNVPDKVVAEQRDLRKQAESDAAENEKKLRDKHLPRDRRDPDPQTGGSAPQVYDQNYAPNKVRDSRGLDTTDNPEGDPNAEVKTFPNDETQRLVGGKRMDGSPQQNPDHDPMAPAPSSPLPGSPPPHPLDQPDPGRVNTSISLGTPPAT